MLSVPWTTEDTPQNYKAHTSTSNGDSFNHTSYHNFPTTIFWLPANFNHAILNKTEVAIVSLAVFHFLSWNSPPFWLALPTLPPSSHVASNRADKLTHTLSYRSREEREALEATQLAKVQEVPQRPTHHKLQILHLLQSHEASSLWQGSCGMSWNQRKGQTLSAFQSTPLDIALETRMHSWNRTSEGLN